MPKPCSESDAYAHPEDRIDRLGRLFSKLKLHDRYGVTFERWLQMIDSGAWQEMAG